MTPPFKTVQDYISYMENHPDVDCPVKKTLNAIGGKWKMFIVLQLFQYKTLRFNELFRHIPGITRAMLTNCLHELEKDAIINRIQFDETPPHVEYSLTERGCTLSDVLIAIANWGIEDSNS